jgi:hypothetical protein
LNDFSPASGRAPIWLVLFDPLPEPHSESPSAAFECLESRSLVFEQYLIQDVREQATLDDYFGGAEAVSSWAQALRLSAGRNVWLQLAADDSPATRAAAAVVTAPALVAALQPDVFRLPVHLPDMFPESLLKSVSKAHLVLVTVRLRTLPVQESESVSNPFSAADQNQVVDHTLAWLERLAAAALHGQKAPVWLVTGFRGPSRPLTSPFESGADESQFHVPLWWTEPLSAGTRLQSLCGSFDLLPTLAELLEDHEESTELDAGKGAEATAVAAESGSSPCAPVSLLSPQLQGTAGGERLLKLRHDSWQGLRTSQYFLVQSQETPSEDTGDAGEFAGQQLYLKPEDYWNVNNSIVSYAEIAREMTDGV